eukprot:2674703-Amphidinium_carterae.1
MIDIASLVHDFTAHNTRRGPGSTLFAHLLMVLLIIVVHHVLLLRFALSKGEVKCCQLRSLCAAIA